MPRNRSEKVPQYSLVVTAWLIASHQLRALKEIGYASEAAFYEELTDADKGLWGDMGWSKLDPIAKQVYDAAQSK